MEYRDRQRSVSAMSNLSNAMSALNVGSRPRRLSVSSSVATSRKTSRIELVKMPGGTMLLEVNEAMDDAISVVSMRRDSLSGATTIGGLAATADTKEVDKMIKKEMAHHSPEIGGDDKKDSEEQSEGVSDTVGPSAHKDDEPLLNYGVINLLHHIYLAIASPAIFRMPALAHKWSDDEWGSGFFLVYLTVMLVVAMPLCVLEEIMAQFSSLGTITVFRCLPLLKGVGVGMVAVCFVLMLYSGTVFCWSILYVFDCFHTTLPWTHCLHNVSYCREVHNLSNIAAKPGEAMIPSEYYFMHEILGAIPKEEGNSLSLELSISLSFLWLGLLFLMTLGGPWRSGVFSKIIALTGLSMLLALMFSGLPLENSGKGLNMVFHIKFKDFAQPDIWLDALGQVMWTLGPTLGILIARASYKNFRDRIRLDVYSATAANIIVALVVLMALTPFHGHLNLQGNVDKNPGYFFVMSSYAMTTLAVPQLGSVVLYLVVCKALVDHTHMLASTVVISLSDLLPAKWRTGGRKFFCQFIVCALGFVCGLPFVMTESIYLLRAVDTYVPWVNALALGFMEAIGLIYIYGAVRIRNHFKIMIRQSLLVFVYFWKFVVPPALLALAVWTTVVGVHGPDPWNNWTHIEISSSREDMYETAGIITSLLPPAVALTSTLVVIFMYRNNLKALLVPGERWAPALDQHRALYTVGIRRAKSKAPYLVVEVENEVIEGTPYKGWIPYGFFLVPSKFSSLCMTEGFVPTDTFTKIKIAQHLLEQFGCPQELEDEVDRHHDVTGMSLLQRIVTDSQNHENDFNEDQNLTDYQRDRHGSSLSVGVVLQPNGVSDSLNLDELSTRSQSASLTFDNIAFQK